MSQRVVLIAGPLRIRVVVSEGPLRLRAAVTDSKVRIRVVAKPHGTVISPPRVRAVAVSHEGPRGPSGPSGGGFSYVHTQAIPSNIWTIQHNLGGFPNVTIVDQTGEVLEGDVIYVSDMIIRVEFGTTSIAGHAYLS